MPLVIDKMGVDIVHGCQLRCIGCPNSTIKPKVKKMPVSDFSTILSNTDVSRIELLRLFNFGEPLLNENLPAILEEIPMRSFHVDAIEISTNAQFCEPDVLKEAMQTGVLTRLVVSCDGDGTADDYERLRPPGRWSKLIEFFELAKSLRDEFQPDLQLMTRSICKNLEDQQRWRRVLEPRGWTPEFRGWLHLPGAEQNMVQRKLRIPTGRCSFIAPGNRIYVDYDGTVVPCCVHPRAAVFGNLLEQKYSEILNGEMRMSVIKEMQTNRMGMPICNECEF